MLSSQQAIKSFQDGDAFLLFILTIFFKESWQKRRKACSDNVRNFYSNGYDRDESSRFNRSDRKVEI